MSKNKLKRKQDKRKKRLESNKSKVLKQRKSLREKARLEDKTKKMEREIEKLKNRASGATIRKIKETEQ